MEIATSSINDRSEEREIVILQEIVRGARCEDCKDLINEGEEVGHPRICEECKD